MINEESFEEKLKKIQKLLGNLKDDIENDIEINNLDYEEIVKLIDDKRCEYTIKLDRKINAEGTDCEITGNDPRTFKSVSRIHSYT